MRKPLMPEVLDAIRKARREPEPDIEQEAIEAYRRMIDRANRSTDREIWGRRPLKQEP